MSEARTPSPARFDPERIVKLALHAMIYSRGEDRAAKVCGQLIRAADALAERAGPLANVYPIRGGGSAWGDRPADLEMREAARILREAAELRFDASLRGAK